jgi:antitoxin component YwqK of YwqJK toxin-antitoxin module
MIEVENDGRIVYRLPIINGKEHGLAIGFYNSGEKLLERKFIKGEKQGVFKQWWPNGRLRYLISIRINMMANKLSIFTSEKFKKKKNYLNGTEEGVQRI